MLFEKTTSICFMFFEQFEVNNDILKKTRCIKKNYNENDMNNLMILYLFEHPFFFISEKHFITMLDFILRYFYIYNTKQNYQKKGQHQFFFGMNQQIKHNGTTKQFEVKQ
jgi:hypothetical protein